MSLKELNRVVSHGLCLGFTDLLERLAEMLEKEAHLPTSSLDTKRHCCHVVDLLRSPADLHYNAGKPVAPPSSSALR